MAPFSPWWDFTVLMLWIIAAVLVLVMILVGFHLRYVQGKPKLRHVVKPDHDDGCSCEECFLFPVWKQMAEREYLHELGLYEIRHGHGLSYKAHRAVLEQAEQRYS